MLPTRRMMQVPKFKHKLQANWRKGLFKLLTTLLFFVFINYDTHAQQLVKSKVDTIILSPYEYATLGTKNGSPCICNINNLSNAQTATVVNTGDTENRTFNDSTLFNGIHILKAKQQIIAVSDFKGSQLIVSNFSPYAILILVSILCPQDE